MKPRSPIKKISAKRLAAVGNKMPFSSISPSGKGVKRVNTKRRKSEFARCYHSKQRVEWVKSQGCVACGGMTGCDNAHVETGGMGRKADYTKIVPLCSDYLGEPGCHSYLHDEGVASLEGAYGIDLDWLADETEKLWLEHSGESKA